MTIGRDAGTPALSIGARVAPAPPELSFTGVAGLLLRNRRRVILATVLVPLVLVGIGLLRDRTYTTSVTFLPQGKRPPANLASLALQLGVNMPTGMDAAQSPAFYADLVRSRVILSQLADGRYPTTTAPASVMWLPDALDIDDDKPPAWRRDEAMRELARDVLSVGSSPRTGVVNFAVETNSPQLSFALANAVIQAVSLFNQEIRQSQASAERQFTESRVQQARGELAAAEAALEEFDRVNRVADSPTLALRRARLNREVDLRTQVYTTLAQSYEQARIDEVRDTPVMTLIDAPEVAVRPNSRRLAITGAAGLLLGLLLGIAWSVVIDRRWRTSGVGDEELRVLWSETVTDLRRPWRLLKGGRARASAG